MEAGNSLRDDFMYNMNQCGWEEDNGPAVEAEYLFGASFALFFKEKHLTGSKFLRIPNRFVEDHGHKIGDYVVLNGPTGFKCSVHMLYVKGLEMRKGFDQFAAYHELKAGDCLSFTLVAESQFSVEICDRYEVKKTMFSRKRTAEYAAEQVENQPSHGIDQPVVTEKRKRGRPRVHTPHQCQDGDGCGKRTRNEYRAAASNQEIYENVRSHVQHSQPRQNAPGCDEVVRPPVNPRADAEEGDNDPEMRAQRLRVLQMLQQSLPTASATATEITRPAICLQHPPECNRTLDMRFSGSVPELATSQERMHMQNQRTNPPSSFQSPRGDNLRTVDVALVRPKRKCTSHDSMRPSQMSPPTVHEDRDYNGLQSVSNPNSTSRLTDVVDTAEIQHLERVQRGLTLEEHLMSIPEVTGVFSEGVENRSAAMQASGTVHPTTMIYINKTVSSFSLLYFFLVSAEKWLKQCQHKHVLLTNQRGKKWAVVWDPEDRRPFLETGWSAFVKDNNLKRGDICVLKLVHSTPIEFAVSFFRESRHRNESPNCQQSNDDSSRCSMKLDSPAKRLEYGVEKGWRSDGDGRVERRRRHRSHIHVKLESELGKFNYSSDCPGMYSTRPYPQLFRHAAARVPTNTSPTTIYLELPEMAAMKRTLRHKLTLRARHEKHGKEKVCVSQELLNAADGLKLYNPHAAPAMKETHVEQAGLPDLNADPPIHQVNHLQELVAVCARKPITYVLITQTSVNLPFELAFSEEFVKTVMPQKLVQVILMDNKKQEWPVTWIGAGEAGAQRLCGLEAFSSNHHLKVGDVCQFELWNHAPLTFMVHVFEARRQEDFDHQKRTPRVAARTATTSPMNSPLVKKGLIRALELANRRKTDER